MAIALVTNTGKAGNFAGVATDAVDTTGADLIVLVCGYYSMVSTPAFSDSKGNSYTVLTGYSTANPRVVMAYCAAPTVGSGHTFTVSQVGSYGSLCVLAFSGTNASPFDTENGASGTGATSSQPGSITPSQNGCVVVSGADLHGGSASSIDGGFTIADNIAGGANNFAVASAYLVQTTAAAANPTWTHDSSRDWADAIASFKAAAAAPSGNPWYYYAQQQAVCG